MPVVCPDHACSRRRRAALVCASAGGPALQSGRRRVRGVWSDSVRLGAAAHVSGGVLLPGAQTGSGAGEWSDTRNTLPLWIPV